MVQESTLAVLRPHFHSSVSLRWFAAGTAVGIYAWEWGQSPLSAWALKLVTGFGALLVLPLCVVSILAIVALMSKNRMGVLAYGDFRNFLPWVLAKLLRSASAFFGVVVVAGVCWCVSGSVNALVVASLGSFLGGALAYCWGGMLLIAQDLATMV
ncbi:hypothetical protein RugamoR64_39490 [Duganella rhizosphaerae]|uniref:hypothetical protein n=1 Tax=Duganella rhizosphaerae TaxID=2885763 RepID=UPI0030E8D710